MLNKEVTYIERKFLVSDQLPAHIVALQESSEYSDRLMSVLINQMQKREWCSGAEEDFKDWREPTEKIAKELIVKASKSGVYDLTKEEMIDNNPAFKQLHNICSQCMEGMKRVLLQAMNDWMEGYDRAYNNAASNITGPGFGVLTNSFASAMLYEAVSYSALKQQARQADKEFSESLTQLNASNQNQRDRENAKVLADYYSSVKNIIPSVIANMMEVYFAKLDSVGAINLSELHSYDMQASDSILKNLDVIESKADVLYKAFEKCPYNPEVYIKAASYGLLNEETFDTAKYLHQEGGLIAAVQEGCKKSLDSKRPDLVLNSLRLLAHVKQQPVESVAKTEFADYTSTITNEYLHMREAIGNYSKLKSWIKSNISAQAKDLCDYDKERVFNAVNKKLDSIITEDEYKLYRDIYALGPQDISIDESDTVEDLKSINAKYIDLLVSSICSFIQELRKKREVYQDAYNKCQQEKTRLEREKSALSDERKSLSVFKFSAKKELDSQIAEIEKEISSLEYKYSLRKLEADFTYM